MRPGAPPGSSWGVFGDDDEVGTLNLIGPEQVAAAAALVRRGEVFSLNWDVALPDPPFFGRRRVRHTLFEKYGGTAVDDYLDSFYPQCSSQWDGLRHFGDPNYGFYNGARFAEVAKPGAGRLGIEHWARRGIVARGVLLDIARALEHEGIALDPFDFFPIGPELLERVTARQSVDLRTGDILLLRTGWVEAYEELDRQRRAALAARHRPASPGLCGVDIPAFLWDHQIAAVAADNPTLEAVRPGEGAGLPLHEALIARLGMPLGELWRLGPLAADCAEDGVFEVLLMSAPLNVAGGAGSPANALALK